MEGVHVTPVVFYGVGDEESYESIGQFKAVLKSKKVQRNKYILQLAHSESQFLTSQFLRELAANNAGCTLTASDPFVHIYMNGPLNEVELMCQEIQSAIWKYQKEAESLYEESTRIYEQNLGAMAVGQLHGFTLNNQILYAFQASEEAKEVILGKGGFVKKSVEKRLKVKIIASPEEHLIRMKGDENDILQGYEYIRNIAQDARDKCPTEKEAKTECLDYDENDAEAECLDSDENETKAECLEEEQGYILNVILEPTAQNVPAQNPSKKRFMTLFATVVAIITIALALFLYVVLVVHNEEMTACQIQAQAEMERYVEYERQVAELNTWLQNQPTTFYQVKLAEVPVPITCVSLLWH